MRRVNATAAAALAVLLLAACGTAESTETGEKAATSKTTESSTAPSSSSPIPGEEQEGALKIIESIRSIPGVDGVYLDDQDRATGIVTTKTARTKVLAAGAQAVDADPGKAELVKMQNAVLNAPEAKTELGETGINLATQTLQVGVHDPSSAWAKELKKRPHVTVFQSDGGAPDGATTQ